MDSNGLKLRRKSLERLEDFRFAGGPEDANEVPILLIRLAWLCVREHGFSWFLAGN
jgi:hypothetical protein